MRYLLEYNGQRLLWACIIVVLAGLMSRASAQEPSDQDIIDLHTICQRSENITTIYQPTPPSITKMTGKQYKPEWTKCIKIDAEYEKRSLAKKSQDQKDINRLNALEGKLK